MTDGSLLNEKRIQWLMDHSALWYDEDDMIDPEWEMEELKRKMRNAGLYNSGTRNSSINVKPLISKARKRLDHESELF